ncbi:hypothetical protein M406DRAFT_330603 [Cryphonectria parasitica EP155]|uniref:TLC domain-containing protein n=1 Tax=Cryphonectria parasitica (strain ATCC 38755 / EP155) TaxID=660469 RepID=A0A9P4Y0H0_CRYP1|nr:uncharacterized protein M406DRAFT_330603 [Cryphonectria parasitica EP155]KAF3764258.1 hypothetical protein M406DRAFT_330603 [Cryphonectria parasitica EP155]
MAPKQQFWDHIPQSFGTLHCDLGVRLVGLGFKLFTIPTCAFAAWVTPAVDDVAGIHPPMNIYQQTCWGARGTATLIELVHFSQHPELVLHHVLILVGMSVIWTFNVPHRGFDLALGALLSEIPNSCYMIFKELNIFGNHPVLEWTLPLISAASGFMFRVPAAIMAMAMIPTSGMYGGPALVMVIAYLFYLVYVGNLTWRRLRRAGIWQAEGVDSFSFRISRHITISSATFFTCLAALSCQFSALFLYSIYKKWPTPATTPELVMITWHSLPALLLGLSTSYWAGLQVKQALKKCRSDLRFISPGVGEDAEAGDYGPLGSDAKKSPLLEKT